MSQKPQGPAIKALYALKGMDASSGGSGDRGSRPLSAGSRTSSTGSLYSPSAPGAPAGEEDTGAVESRLRIVKRHRQNSPSAGGGAPGEGLGAAAEPPAAHFPRYQAGDHVERGSVLAQLAAELLDAQLFAGCGTHA